MLTQTTELAVAILTYLAMQDSQGPTALGLIADRLGSSPSYTAKVMHLLSRDRITRTKRGVSGGIELIRPANTISLLEVIELCQGRILADFSAVPDDAACAYHSAMNELRTSVRGALSHWTIADLAAASKCQHSFSCLHAIVNTGHTLHQPGPVPVLAGGPEVSE